MHPRRQAFGLNRPEGGRRSSATNFGSAVSSLRRGSTVLPSVLTFLVIVASGGLLMMIEKGMLNGMETPAPRGNGGRPDLIRQRRGPGGVDVESQVLLQLQDVGGHVHAAGQLKVMLGLIQQKLSVIMECNHDQGDNQDEDASLKKCFPNPFHQALLKEEDALLHDTIQAARWCRTQ